LPNQVVEEQKLPISLNFDILSVVTGNRFELVEELFKATKPGLSSFADNPQKV